MQHDHLEVTLAELHRKFELVLEDYTALHAEVQLLRRETREHQELAMFLLRTMAADLIGHCADSSVHAGPRAKSQRRLAPRSRLLSS